MIELDIDGEVIVVLDDEVGKDCVLCEVGAWLSEGCKYIILKHKTMKKGQLEELPLYSR